MIRRWLAVLALTALPFVAQADIFMLVNTLPGDATAKGHENWIRVSSLDWKVQAQTAWTAGGGSSVGKPVPDRMQLVLPTGPWSQYFMRMIGLGRALPKVVFDATASDGRPLYRVTVEGMFLTQYRIASLPEKPLPQDHIEVVFKTVRIDYYATGADGRLVTTTVEWNIPAGTVVPPL
jgi:type VI protein secretion system component Hcp